MAPLTQLSYGELGAVGLLVLILFFLVRSIVKTNRQLIRDNQDNIKEFMQALNHQQTKNRDALHNNTVILEKMTANLDQNNHINEKLISYLKKNGH